MSERMKMVASALVASALTAALFLTFGARPAIDPGPAGRPAGASGGPAAFPSGGRSVADLPTDPEGTLAVPPVEGDGVITGRVLTESGEGVRGIVIVTTPNPVRTRRPPGAPPPVSDLEAELVRAEAATRHRVLGTRRATTDGTGGYRVSGLGPGGHRVYAYSEHHLIRPAKGSRTYDVRSGAEVNFTATAVARIRVQVEGLDEKIAGLTLVLSAPDVESLSRAGGLRWSPENPWLMRPPGTWWLQAVQGDDREKKSAPQEVTFVAGAETPTVVLVLSDAPGLRGRIVPRDDLDPQRVRVYALRFAGEEPPPVASLLRNRSAVSGNYDRRDRSFSFPGIKPGRYLVWVTLGGRRVMGSAVVRIEDRMVDQEIEVGVDDPERYVVVRVIGPDGEPLPPHGLRISTSYTGPGAMVGGGGEAIHRTDGSWLVAQSDQVPPPDEQSGGTYKLSVHHSKLGGQERTYDPRFRDDLVFRFGRPSTVTVTVTGFESPEPEGPVTLSLMASMPSNSIHGGNKEAEAGDGVFLFTDVQPGPWFVVLSRGVLVDRLAITVREGENRITWPVPPLHTVRVTVGTKARTGTWGLRRIDPSGNWMKQFASPREGRDAIYPYVPTGRYELEGNLDGKRTVIPIDVPGQTEVRLE